LARTERQLFRPNRKTGAQTAELSARSEKHPHEPTVAAHGDENGRWEAKNGCFGLKATCTEAQERRTEANYCRTDAKKTCMERANGGTEVN
jgi:hypothetical protein